MMRRFLAAFVLLGALASGAPKLAFAQGYFQGILKPHNHTTAAGDGGLLSNLNVSHSLEVQGPDPFVSVKWYGAKGDGSTDDTAAIRSAVAANFASGYAGVSEIYFPPGNYQISGSITLQEGQSVRCSGFGSIIALTSASTAAFVVAGDRVRISNCFINGSTSLANTIGVQIGSATWVTDFSRLDHLFFQSFSTAVYVNGGTTGESEYIGLDDIDIKSSTFGVVLAADRGALNNGPNGATLHNVRVGQYANGTGFYLFNAGQMICTGCHAEGMNYGFYIATTTVGDNHGSEGNVIVGARVEGNTVADFFLSTSAVYTVIYGSDYQPSKVIDNGNATTIFGLPGVFYIDGGIQSWTPAANSGCSGALTVNKAIYQLDGKKYWFTVDVQCTSNSTGWSFTMPFTSGSTSDLAYCMVSDNGTGTTFKTTPGELNPTAVGSTVIAAYIDTSQSTNWTASNTKRVICTGTISKQ